MNSHAKKNKTLQLHSLRQTDTNIHSGQLTIMISDFNAKIILLLLMLSAGSCRQRETVVPLEIIQLEKMSQVVADIQLAEAAIGVKALNGNALIKESLDHYTNILAKYDVSRESFEESFDFYAKRPELLEQMFEQVINELSKKQAETE